MLTIQCPNCNNPHTYIHGVGQTCPYCGNLDVVSYETALEIASSSNAATLLITDSTTTQTLAEE